MNCNKKQTEKEIQNKIKKVDGAMAQEGMPLTKENQQPKQSEIRYQKSIRESMDNKYTYEKTDNYCYKDTDVNK